jgi:hypothetical protein
LVATDTATIPLRWTPTPGYWDVAAFNNAGTHYVSIIQPHAFSTVGANVTIDINTCTVSGAVISVSLFNNVSTLCNGPCAFGANDVTSFPYVITTSSGNLVNGCVFDHLGNLTKVYSFGAVLAGSGVPDGITGWIEFNGSGNIAHAAYSLLSNFSPPAGPPNDPGLRYTRSYACTFAGAVTLTNQVNGVLLSSRAFRIDDDWYAATYYQSGAGNVTAPAVQTIVTDDTDDYFTGATSQPVTVAANDFATGGAGVPLGAGYVVPTQFSGAIAHNAADNVAATTRTWHFVNAVFTGIGTAPFDGTSQGPSAAGALLHITGAANAGNNGDWWITSVTSATDVVTESTSLQGNPMVTETFGVGVTVTVTQVWPFFIPQATTGTFAGNTHYPDVVMYNKFTGGTIVATGFSGAAVAVLGTYSIFRMYTASAWRGYTPGNCDIVLCQKSSGAAGVDGTTYAYGGTLFPPAGLAITPLVPNDWALLGFSGSSGNRDQRSGVAMNLVVTGAQKGGNNGTFLETGSSSNYNRTGLLTGSQPAQQAELFLGFGASLPSVSREMVDPSKAFMWHLKNLTLDASYIGATMVMTGSLHPEDNGVYTIVSLVPSVDAHTFIAVPADGHTGQTLYNMVSSEIVTITRSASAGTPAAQPCWFLTPLSVRQRVAGRWEWGIAYGDWRFDGNTKANTGTFERNNYPLALSSVVPQTGGKGLVLPYRAQSFTAGQTIKGTSGGIIGIQSTEESTVGLKLFSVASAAGQASANAGEMLLPGMQASQFSLTGFPEDGINIGPEKPFLAAGSPSTAAIALGLTLNATVQYVVVFEVTDETGDRVWSITSPPLDVSLQGTQNTVTLSGRMPGPTNRIVGVAIYRTANIGGVPTVQRYKVTNDLDVNGANFTFSSVNGGGDSDTWQYVDQAPDQNILSAEVVYIDQGSLQRFPAPAQSQGFSSWKGRDWVVGYDGAIWMSDEKQEGDSIWWHPAFRYTAFGDDKPVAVCGMDDYMLVFCSRSIWYIPAATFPDATGRNGTLPTPVQLPFQNGGTGFAKAIRAGVAYSSTAGGCWLMTRDLRNVWLSQPVRDSMGAITGMAINSDQRLAVTTVTGSVFVYDQVTEGWWEWTMQAVPVAPAVFGGELAILDLGGYTMLQTPGVFLDNRGGSTFPIVPDITFSSLNFGTVRAFKCLWAMQIVGEYKGPHRLNVIMTYPDDDHGPTVFGPWTPDPAKLYIFEVNPMFEEASSYGVRIYCDFVGVVTPGNSFTLELLSCEIGLEPGINRIPSGRRISGT